MVEEGVHCAKVHRESSLYLHCRFSQLSSEIPGDVLFPQDGPLKFTQLSTQIEKFHRFAEEDSFSIILWVLADKQIRMGKEDKIGTEVFRWARARYSTATRLQLEGPLPLDAPPAAIYYSIQFQEFVRAT